MTVRGADFSRTCEGCRSVKRDRKAKLGTMFRCCAEGPHKGRSVGIGRYEPYVPAWCPERAKGAINYGSKK